jgi:phosphoglycerate dehydrogenase-like enzyme
LSRDPRVLADQRVIGGASKSSSRLDATEIDQPARAAIDVFSIQPLPADHPFRRLDNVLATPHVGYVAEDLYRTFYGDTAAAVAA